MSDEEMRRRLKREVERERKRMEEIERIAKKSLKTAIKGPLLSEGEKERLAEAVMSQVAAERRKRRERDEAKSHEMQFRRR